MDVDASAAPAVERSVDIIVVLDKSGSMEQNRDDTIGSFNSLIKDQQATPNAKLSLITFSNTPELVLNRVPIADVPPLTRDNYSPSGWTALRDAIGDALDLGDRAAPGALVIVAIITDGEENYSRRIQRSALVTGFNARVARGWHFEFLAANQDSVLGAEELGLDSAATNCTNFVADSIGITQAFTSLSRAVSSASDQYYSQP